VTTVLQYLVIAAVIGLVLFGIALLLFGRGEQLAALPARTSPAQLPAEEITGGDVRKVRFALAVRGYRMSDVDWTLDRLADELDRTRERLAAVESPTRGDDSGDVDPQAAAEAIPEDSSGAEAEPVVTDGADVQTAESSEPQNLLTAETELARADDADLVPDGTELEPEAGSDLFATEPENPPPAGQSPDGPRSGV
jgi:DivIVA domain-containing protein